MSIPMIRPARGADIPAMLDLSARKREQYEVHHPVFHRRAANARAAQNEYFHTLLTRDDVVVLVADDDGAVVGFGTAEIHTAPVVSTIPAAPRR
ncbi:MAG TPA: hypothetical protein VIG86_04750 [Candidatus Dormibacteraeota bacterium]|jgi:hypothetical protein